MDISDIDSGVDSARDCAEELARSVRDDPEMYRVTWLSTDGRRGLLLVLSEAVYFVEGPMKLTMTTSSTATAALRDTISVFVVTSMKFPSPKDYAKTQHRTLLDVVLVKDVEGSRTTYRFYVLDMLCIEGGTVWHKPWDQRWRFLNEGVLIPRKKDESMQLQRRGSQQPSSMPLTHAYSKEMIKIRAVEYFPMKKLEFVLKDVCDGVAHEARGVRVVPVGRYGIGEEDRGGANEGGASSSTTTALIWRRGCRVDEGRLKTMLLAAP
jgi:hypothetical protein